LPKHFRGSQNNVDPLPWNSGGGPPRQNKSSREYDEPWHGGQPALDLDLGLLPQGAAVADIVYRPLETPLLTAARKRGLRTIDGLGMLLHQAVRLSLPGSASSLRSHQHCVPTFLSRSKVDGC